MEIDVKITLPDDLSGFDSEKVSRQVMEQVVAEGYRDGRLSLKQVQILLGFSSRVEAEGFLHARKATVYTVEDLKNDLENMKDLGLR